MSKHLSIIIPVYNVEQYINECLDSVLSNTYSNLEIIIINDGANDSSMELIREYKKHSHIFIAHQFNGGQSSARNLGIELIKNTTLRKICDFIKKYDKDSSEFDEFLKNLDLSEISFKDGKNLDSIIEEIRCVNDEIYFDFNNIHEILIQKLPPNQFVNFVDGDDTIPIKSRDYIMSILEREENSMVDLISYDYRNFFTDIIPWETDNDSLRLQNMIKVFKNKPIDGVTFFNHYKPCHFSCVVSAFFRTDILNTKDLRFITGLTFEDFIFGVSLFAYSKNMIFLNEVHYHYRIRPKSTCGYGGWKNFGETKDEMPGFLKSLYPIFQDTAECRLYNCLFSWAFMINSINKEFRGFLNDEFLDNLTNSYVMRILTRYNYRWSVDPYNLRQNLQEVRQYLCTKARYGLFLIKFPYLLFMYRAFLILPGKLHRLACICSNVVLYPQTKRLLRKIKRRLNSSLDSK